MTIKLILIFAVCSASAIALRSQTARYLAVKRIVGLALSIAAVLAILFPNALTEVANAVGVGRGSDLVLYLLVVAFMFVSIGLHQRIHMLELRLIRLSRELALQSDTQTPSSTQQPPAIARIE